MGIARQVYEFLKAANIAHAKWDYEVSMSIIQSKKKLALIGVMLLPVFIGIALATEGGQDMIGGKQAFAPAFYTPNIFLISIFIG